MLQKINMNKRKMKKEKQKIKEKLQNIDTQKEKKTTVHKLQL